MLKHYRKLLTGAAATAAAAAIAVAGVTAASAAPRSGAADSGIEHIQLMSTSATSHTSSIIVHGVFTAGGTDVQGKHEIATFPNGTLQIRHSRSSGSQSFNPQTCLFTVHETGTYQLVSGTGAYEDVSGHGSYQLSILGVGAKSGGKCSQKLPPAAFHLVIDASGPASLH